MKNASAIERCIEENPCCTDPECKIYVELKQAARTELAGMQERLAELEALPKEWEGSGYSPQQCARIVKLYQGLQKELAIREEALAPVKQLAEKWLRWAGKPTQEAVGCGNTDDERNEAANDAYRDAANSLLTLIDKPGGR